MKKLIALIAIILVIVIGSIALCVLGVWDANYTSDENYNNGICDICGGEYYFSGANYVNFYYSCKDCGHTIITHHIMK